jgi:hypothetical protein
MNIKVRDITWHALETCVDTGLQYAFPLSYLFLNYVHQESPNARLRTPGRPRNGENLKMLIIFSSLFPDDRKSRGDFRSLDGISVECRGTRHV